MSTRKHEDALADASGKAMVDAVARHAVPTSNITSTTRPGHKGHVESEG